MSRSKFALAALALTAIAVLSFGGSPTPAVPGAESTPAFVPGELIVKFKAGTGNLDRSLARSNFGARQLRSFRSKAEVWELRTGVRVNDAVRQLKARSDVLYAEPNYIWTANVVPNDPLMADLWNMLNTGQTGGTVDADIDADMAWGVSTGSHDVVVAVIDTGIDYNHPDLAANVWTNPGEIPGNGIDDDGNGYIDDIHGWDWVNDDNDPFDDHGHGTHTSGTIGAVGDNGIGVVGVNWNVSIMGLKFLDAGGSGTTEDAVSAVEYATMMGVDLTSNSWGGGGFSQALYDVIAAAGAADQLFIAAAGNGGTDTDLNPHYPSSYDLANIISVAMTDHNDDYDSLSNWGAVSVDLAAPGSEVLSTLPGNSYGYGSGTSMATPHVAGVAALIRAVSPGVPSAQIKTLIMNSADDVTNPAKPTVTNARLNAFFAIADPDDIPPAPITDLATADPTSNTIGLSWTATGDDGTDGTATYYEVRYSTDPIDDTNWDMAALAPNAPPPAPSGTPESMEVTGLDANTFYYFAIKAFDEWANASDLGANATGTTLPPPTADASPLSVTDSLLTGESSTHIVTLTNVGVGTLDYTIPTPLVGEPIAAALPIVFGKDEQDPRGGDPVAASTGGPDGGGYRWIDSDEPGGPVFSWNDISTTGILVGPLSDDDTTDPIALNFSFPFYGQLFDSIRIASNGFVSFTSTSTAYSNQPLPSSGAPENLLAPFWDDLNPTVGGDIYYQLFSNQMVVQYNEVAHYGTTEPGTYTFQVILDAGGAITYQYLTLVGTLNSCTVGIQDGTKSLGTTIAFNQEYLHDNMAIRIAAIPQWLTVSPTAGRLYGGESVNLNVNLDASGLEGALYPGEVHILNNDPANPDIVVAVALDVEGAPDATVSPTSLHYGDGYQFVSYELPLTVTNIGTDVLHVTDIVVAGKVVPDIVASPTSFNLLPHASQVVTVTWTPSVLGPFFGSLTILSDDAGEPQILVPVTGNGVTAPEVVLNPTSFEETLFTGGKVRRTLSVTNTGGSALDIFQAATDLGGASLVVVNDNGTTGSGGPDAFGYSWSDSDDPGGPAFDWVDISGIGTPIDLGTPPADDDNSGPLPLGFTFPFYGNMFATVNVCSNGWLSFTSTSTDYTNGALPGTSAPENLIAPFHDDLRFSSAGADAHYYNDGSRFIVQYTDVQKYFSNGSLTFQVILYPNGKIVYQYLTMTDAVLTSATVGIQNDDRSIGLQVAYNEDYIHDNLAVQISTTPDWLTVSPSSATVPAGETFDFDVVFDATDRDGGDLVGAVVLDTNIGQYQAPATLHVIGVPIASIIPDAYDYGTRYAGYSHLTNFRVVNTGTDVLNVSEIVSTDPTLVIGELQAGDGGQEITQINAGFSLAPGAARLFALAWQPVDAVALDAQVVVHSDDPVNPTISMEVTGNAIFPPVAVWTPASFTENLLAGDVVNRTLHLENQGLSDLTYTVALQEIGAANVTVYPDVKVGKGEELPGPGILGSGGPDMYGYKWVDSDEAGGPTFDWVDISAIGTPVDLGPPPADDDNSGPIDMGMSFPFYGDTFTTVNVCSNGWLSFTSTSTDLSNSALPGTGSPENLLAAFHDDLRFSSSGAAAHTYFDGTRFIVQYTDVQKYFSTGSLTFQMILYPNGRIVYQYLTMQGTLNSATIGIQNATRDDGLTVAYNTDYVHDAMAIMFRPLVDWLSVSPTSGTVPAGAFVDLNVTIDASLLIGGDYAANIDLTTNDPANGLIQVPVNVHVTGIPDINVDPASLAFPTTFVGYGSTLPLTVSNVGSDVLTITDYTLTGDFSQTGLTLPVSLAVGQTLPVNVEFLPAVAGVHNGTLTLISDDPDEASLEISLSGDALIAPVIETTPTFIDTALAPGGTTDVTLQICNTGGSNLNWESAANVSSGGLVTVHSELELGKEDPDPRPGILGAGGPDMFGYTWTDSDEPGGPVYDWFDISGVGTPIFDGYSDDGNSGALPLSFPFKFYGQTFNEFYACTNGWVSFTSTKTSYTNQPLPNSGSGVPENLLALFWDDLVHRSGTGSEPTASAVYYYDDGTRFIIQFDNMYRIAQYNDNLTFQVILYPSGKIVYQYETLSATTLDSNTVGIQNDLKDDGLTAVYNDVFVHENMAVQFSATPEWLLLDPTSGTIPAGECQDVTVTLDASELAEGIHDATIDLTSNDPSNPLYQVPVTLNVNQPPVAMCADAVVATGPNNCIADASIDNGSYDPDGGPVTLVQDPAGPYPLGDTMVTLIVTDETGLTGSCTATVTVVDVTPPELMVSLSPDNLWPPNHQMVDVEAIVIATDNCGDPMVILTGVGSNEDDNGSGDGNTINDIQDAEIGTSDFMFKLRAERSAHGEGRIYTVVYTAMDSSGNMASAEAYAFVPHDQSDPILINVAPSVAGTTISWPVVEEAVHYNVIRGYLKDVRDAGDVYDLGQVFCIESHSLDENTVGSEDFNTPRPGQMFIYMVEFNFADGTTSTYGTDTADKPRYPTSGACQ